MRQGTGESRKGTGSKGQDPKSTPSSDIKSRKPVADGVVDCSAFAKLQMVTF